MTLSDLNAHLFRLEVVRKQILDQGDDIPADLLRRIEEVRALLAEVNERWARIEQDRIEQARAVRRWDIDDLAIELALDD